jgi:hypothetical protein
MAQILRDCEITKEELQILLSLEEIGAYFGMKASAVSQTSRQFKTRTGKEGETDKMLCGILTKLHSVENRRAVAQAKGLRFDSLRANDAML